MLARAEVGGTLKALYDPKKMPSELADVHLQNDLAVERVYSDREFRNDADRLNHLFRRYAKLIGDDGNVNGDIDAEFDFED